MTDAPPVTLSILESSFEVVSDDERMAELVALLWAPFASDAGDATRLSVSTSDLGWRVEAPDYPGGVSPDPWTALAVLRSLLSGRAIRAAGGIVPVHGAAVERDGRVVVLSGPARAGKTTLLVALLERGWAYVTDDLVPVAHATLEATPFAKPLSIREPALWRRLEHLWAVPGWMPAPVEVGLVPATAFPASSTPSYVPDVVVFPRFSPGAEPEMEALTPAAGAALAADNLHVPPGDPAHLATLARLGSRARAYRLSYGSTEVALELLGNCLAGRQAME